MARTTTPTIARFAALSLVVHAIVLVPGWTPLMPKPPVSATLSVGFATPAAAPAMSQATAPVQTQSKASAPQSETREPAPKRTQAKASAAPLQHSASAPEPATPVKRIAKTSSPTRMRAQALVTVHPAHIQPGQASAPEEPTAPAKRSFIDIGTPMVSRPWEAVWGSVRSYEPRQSFTPANTPPAQTEVAALGGYPASAAPADENKANELARARVRGRLETDLSRYFSYPVIARKQGWQGHVSVVFTVQPDGQLTDVRVTRSSGYHVLDQSALAALRKVGHLAEARQWLNGRSITVELPVIYRLEN